MKWIFLLLAFSCGQHKEPLFRDIGDVDGDQILNYEELGNDKFFANFTPIGKVKGIMRFHANEFHEISFSNSTDKKQVMTNLLVSNESHLKQSEYFSEWMNLKLHGARSLNLKSKQYLIQLTFESSNESIDEVAIIHGDLSESLGNWSPFMKLEISSENLQDLLSGKKVLGVRKSLGRSNLFKKNKEETIKEKSHRLYFYDGKNPIISYIAKELNLFEVSKILNISQFILIEEEKIILGPPSGEVAWFARELKNGDKIFLKSSVDELRKVLVERFEYKKILIKRENGFLTNSTELRNKVGAKIYVRISDLTRTERKFQDSIRIRVHGRFSSGGSARDGDRDPGFRCHHYIREIKEEIISFPDKDELLGHLFVSTKIGSDGVQLGDKLEEKFNENGTFWDAGFTAEEENLIAGLESLPLVTFTVTGEFNNSCSDRQIGGDRFASFSTNPEGKLSFILESYVEKIL